MPSFLKASVFFSVTLQSLKYLGCLTYRRFLELFRYLVGLLGRVISPSQGLYLHRTTQHRKTRDKHPWLEWDSNPRSQQPTGHDPRLRPHGHCDRQGFCYLEDFRLIFYTYFSSIPRSAHRILIDCVTLIVFIEEYEVQYSVLRSFRQPSIYLWLI
jgi:hypothetical protein